MTTLEEQIQAKEAELAAATEAFRAACDRQNYGSMRTKSFGRRTDSILRGAAEKRAVMQRLESELATLRRKATAPEEAFVDLSKLPNARYIRTWEGWHEVVKVNRATVKVKAAPGMDDLVKVGKILEIREWPTVATETAA